MSSKKALSHCLGLINPDKPLPRFSTWKNYETTVLPKPRLDLDIHFKEQAKEYISVERQTIIHCKFQHSSFFGPQIRVWPSTFLKPAGSSVVCKLLSAVNISFYPQWTRIKPLQTHEFTLIFEGLPKDCTSFDLHEDIPEPGGFYISNIKRNQSDMYQVDV